MKSLYLKPSKDRAVLNRHPWIFSGAVKKTDDVAPGDVVVIKNHDGSPLALGHWCGDDGLVCRIFSFDVNDVPSDALWRQRFNDAHQLRTTLGLPNQKTTGYRLIHGEGDNLSGLVVDVYGRSASIQSSNPGLALVVPLLADYLQDVCGIENIYFTDSVTKQSHWLAGASQPITFLEHGHIFHVDIAAGQKTGHFLDQRDNRQLVSSLAHGRDVLDAFSYSGGFSVYALAGGARSVVSLDNAKSALALAEKNVASNANAGHHSVIAADCFDYLRTIKRDDFDVIILDPPAFAKTSQAVMRASRGYKDINLLALKAIRAGGLVFTYSCSQHIDQDLFKKIVFAAAKDAGRDVRIVKELGQSADHPVSIYCPQSNYLKGLALYVP